MGPIFFLISYSSGINTDPNETPSWTSKLNLKNVLWTWVRGKLTAYNDAPVIVLELVSPRAHLWSLDVDRWHIPCRTELGCCSDSIFHRTLLGYYTPQVWVLNLLLTLMLGAFATLSASLLFDSIFRRTLLGYYAERMHANFKENFI